MVTHESACLYDFTTLSMFPKLRRTTDIACACMSDGQPSLTQRTAQERSRMTSNKKLIHLLRHGRTEMNEHLENNPGDHRGGADTFKDPLFYDTKLTNSGKEEAKRAMHEAGQLQPAPQILLSSPLSRALQTADLAFAKFQGPREAVSLAREKTYFASDVGVPRSELERLWPHWSFKGVDEEIWWLDHAEDKSNPKAVIKESDEHFQMRMTHLQQYLASRPEQSMALVVHRDVIESLAGHSPQNCEFTTIEVE